MRRQRTTLVGTPTVIAPEAIFLVGELGLPEEEVAVLAALSSHATAQYCPDVVAPSPLVAAVVELAKNHLGEAAAALPPGSVLLSPAKPGDGFAFDTTPAIAVATAAAVFEAAGQSPYRPRRSCGASSTTPAQKGRCPSKTLSFLRRHDFMRARISFHGCAEAAPSARCALRTKGLQHPPTPVS